MGTAAARYAACAALALALLAGCDRPVFDPNRVVTPDPAPELAADAGPLTDAAPPADGGSR